MFVDDSHAVGFVGEHGRGTPEYCGVEGRVDITTGTFGKALGGASGGYVAARAEIVDLLRQRARPYLFSNTLAPAIVAGTLRRSSCSSSRASCGSRCDAMPRCSARSWTEEGFDLLPGEHPIVPVMFGDAALTARIADAMLARGVYVTAFSFPVVPQGAARIRVQLSAAHTRGRDPSLRRGVRVGARRGGRSSRVARAASGALPRWGDPVSIQDQRPYGYTPGLM